MNRLRELRKNRGLTQKDVASNIGVSPQSYGYYENEINHPDPQTLINLADFFNCTIDYLLGREDDLGNVITGHTYSPNTEDEEKLLSAFRVLDAVDKETFLIQITAIAKEKRLIKK